MRGMGAGVLLLATYVLAASPSIAHAADRPPTHGMALDSVAVLVAGDLLQGAELPPGRPVVLATPVPGDTLGLLTQRLVERLRARGAAVRLSMHGANGTAPDPTAASGGLEGLAPGEPIPPDMMPHATVTDTAGAGTGGNGAPGASRGVTPHASAAPPGTVQLQLQVDGSGVSYVRRLGKFPFGTKGYERLAAMRAVGTLLDPSTGEVYWTRSASRSVTDIVPKNSVVYAASGSGRLNPVVPKGGTRWLEPLIVVGVVAGLVVLFYSNRN